jgi:hypothetical protein
MVEGKTTVTWEPDAGAVSETGLTHKSEGSLHGQAGRGRQEKRRDRRLTRMMEAPMEANLYREKKKWATDPHVDRTRERQAHRPLNQVN